MANRCNILLMLLFFLSINCGKNNDQKVYKTLGTYLTNEIHALQLKTMTRSKWEKKNLE